MNYCAAILILKMEENMQHFQCIMLYYFQKGKNVTEMQKKKICAVYGEGAIDWSNVSKVVCKVSWYYWRFGQNFFAVGPSYALEDV